MAEEEANQHLRTHAILGEGSRYTRGVPLDERESAMMYTMLRSANTAISNKNLRGLGMVVATRIQANAYKVYPELALRCGPPMHAEVTEKMCDLFCYLGRDRADLTNEVLYTPDNQLWLTESDYNTQIEKMVRESLRQFSASERELIGSGKYPNRDLIQLAVEVAFSLRNKYWDLPHGIFADRQVVPDGDRTSDCDSAYFKVSDRDLLVKLVGDFSDRHCDETEQWKDLIQEDVLHQPVEELSEVPRLKHAVDDFLWKARVSRQREVNEDGSDASLWDMLNHSTGVSIRRRFQEFGNIYIREPLEVLCEAVDAHVAESMGVSIHELVMVDLQNQPMLLLDDEDVELPVARSLTFRRAYQFEKLRQRLQLESMKQATEDDQARELTQALAGLPPVQHPLGEKVNDVLQRIRYFRLSLGVELTVEEQRTLFELFEEVARDQEKPHDGDEEIPDAA